MEIVRKKIIFQLEKVKQWNFNCKNFADFLRKINRKSRRFAKKNRKNLKFLLKSFHLIVELFPRTHIDFQIDGIEKKETIRWELNWKMSLFRLTLKFDLGNVRSSTGGESKGEEPQVSLLAFLLRRRKEKTTTTKQIKCWRKCLRAGIKSSNRVFKCLKMKIWRFSLNFLAGSRKSPAISIRLSESPTENTQNQNVNQKFPLSAVKSRQYFVKFWQYFKASPRQRNSKLVLD